MQATFQQSADLPAASGADERKAGKAIRRGFLNRCPSCGEGRLFKGFLKSVDACSVCGEEMHHHRADDLPPYLVITVIGHVVLAGYMMTDLVLDIGTWTHLAIWAPVTLFGALGLMQPTKGGVIGLQWALKMHGFGGGADEPADSRPPQEPAA